MVILNSSLPFWVKHGTIIAIAIVIITVCLLLCTEFPQGEGERTYEHIFYNHNAFELEELP